jgi:hypothetical protein
MDDEKTAGGGVARRFADSGWRRRQGFVIWGELFVRGRREDPGGLLNLLLFLFILILNLNLSWFCYFFFFFSILEFIK